MNESPSSTTRDRLVGATIDLIRQKGFAATRIDDIAAAAGVSKGAFFHHFASKEAIAVAAAAAWGAGANTLFEAALAHHGSPRDFLIGYLDLRIALIEGEPFSYMCYAGTLLEEVWQNQPEVGRAAAASIDCHVDWLAPRLAGALQDPGRARDVATLIQSGIQGALIIAKTEGGPARARACLTHLKTYVETLLPGGAP